MNRAELAKAVAEELKYTNKEVAQIVDEVVLQMSTAIQQGYAVRLQGFGTLKPVTRAARELCNPKTGEKVQVEAKRTVKFVPSKILLEALN